ncbi:hypothetical protein CALVIDRAFT_264758 [Calocera viscosa TUFC12733]|uniref:Uncharacterized protein n=1 Tax=Calocera viscosa (strain TUFC12733) TaxID=1330018 RepID=A0A167J4V4_CALVF|nr:hypothetical protein CALVIDRAFT_264758 [Calocera viscosa TUFC12733]
MIAEEVPCITAGELPIQQRKRTRDDQCSHGGGPVTTNKKCKPTPDEWLLHKEDISFWVKEDEVSDEEGELEEKHEGYFYIPMPARCRRQAGADKAELAARRRVWYEEEARKLSETGLIVCEPPTVCPDGISIHWKRNLPQIETDVQIDSKPYRKQGANAVRSDLSPESSGSPAAPTLDSAPTPSQPLDINGSVRPDHRENFGSRQPTGGRLSCKRSATAPPTTTLDDDSSRQDMLRSKDDLDADEDDDSCSSSSRSYSPGCFSPSRFSLDLAPTMQCYNQTVQQLATTLTRQAHIEVIDLSMDSDEDEEEAGSQHSRQHSSSSAETSSEEPASSTDESSDAPQEDSKPVPSPFGTHPPTTILRPRQVEQPDNIFKAGKMKVNLFMKEKTKKGRRLFWMEDGVAAVVSHVGDLHRISKEKVAQSIISFHRHGQSAQSRV